MRHFCKLALSAAGAIALSAAGAQAAVVCNDEGDCWRVKKSYEYKPELKLHIYGDDWKWKDEEKHKYRWREAHDGPGYWRKGVWITF
jgi:benzoyl-CoA reductase/2-hydroxyglutaryl-CoA dehydratase subunit BcrC/BadD/HgdB